MAIGAILGLVGSLAAAGASAASNRNAADRSNQYNLEYMREAQKYNSAAAQVARLRAAGLNPNLAYGQIQSGNVSQPSAPNVQPVDYSKFAPSIGELAQTEATYKALQANVEKTKAETDAIRTGIGKTETETEILRSDASFRDALNQKELELRNMNVNLGASTLQLNDQQIKVLRSTVTKIDNEAANIAAQRDQIRATIQNIDADTYKKAVDAYCNQSHTKALVSDLAASAHLKYTEAENIVKMQLYNIANLEADTQNKHYLGSNLVIQGNQMMLDFEMDKTFKAKERATNMVATQLNTLSRVFDSFNPLRFIRVGKN